MRLPRMTTRRWMMAVAALSVTLGGFREATRLKRSRDEFLLRAARHGAIGNPLPPPDLVDRVFRPSDDRCVTIWPPLQDLLQVGSRKRERRLFALVKQYALGPVAQGISLKARGIGVTLNPAPITQMRFAVASGPLDGIVLQGALSCCLFRLPAAGGDSR